MTKQMKAAMAAMLMVGTLPMYAQTPLTTTTKTEKIAPGETKTTVITKENGAAGTRGKTSRGKSAKGKKHAARRKTVKGKKSASTEVRESSTAAELRELRAKQVAQQIQIDALTQQNAAAATSLATANQAAQAAEAQAQAATASTQTVTTSIKANTDAVDALKSNVSDLQTTSTGLAQTISANKQEINEKVDTPTTIHYKGVTITPIGFFALEAGYRTRSINSDINTPFNLTPFPGSNEAHVSEFNFSGRQSRLAGLFEGNAGKFKLSGYFETDFLSSGTTSNSNQSNSYTLRQRQIWGKAETKTGFAVTGGQMFTLVAENGKGTDARTEKLPNTIDPQYNVGYSWARQPGIRIQQKLGNPLFGSAVTVAMSIEQAQTQLGATGNNPPANFIFGGLGQGGGLFNAFNGIYANNVAPDVLTKVAFDFPKSHFEVGGIARFFRDEYFPLILSNTGATTGFSQTLTKNTRTGGGVYGSGRVTLSKFVDVAAQGMYGKGVGRYATAQLGDVTVHPDGTLAPIKNIHGLFTLETHPTKKLDVYAYYGAEYNQRTVYLNATGGLVGYGVANANDSGCNVLTVPVTGIPGTGTGGTPGTANCASPTRAIQEGTVGYTYKIINSPKYGVLRYQFTYSYLQKSAWTGLLSPAATFGTPAQVNINPRATNNLIYAGMRYYIP